VTRAEAADTVPGSIAWAGGGDNEELLDALREENDALRIQVQQLEERTAEYRQCSRPCRGGSPRHCAWSPAGCG
jgi:hypothetical protein